MNQQKDIIRDARVLGTPKMLLLGLQHMFAMFGATILVPILVNSYFQSTSQVLSVQVTLFCAGFGTLFSICVPNLRFLLFWDLHLLFGRLFQRCGTGYRDICQYGR